MVKFATKILQIERKTKKKVIFLCFSEMPPIFEKVSKISNYNETNKYFFIFYSIGAIEILLSQIHLFGVIFAVYV